MDKYIYFLSINLYIYCSSLFIFVFYPTLFISIIPICLYLFHSQFLSPDFNVFSVCFNLFRSNLIHAKFKLNLFISIYTVSFITDFLQRTGSFFFFRLSTLSPFILLFILINSLHMCFRPYLSYSIYICFPCLSLQPFLFLTIWLTCVSAEAVL